MGCKRFHVSLSSLVLGVWSDDGGIDVVSINRLLTDLQRGADDDPPFPFPFPSFPFSFFPFPFPLSLFFFPLSPLYPPFLPYTSADQQLLITPRPSTLSKYQIP